MCDIKISIPHFYCLEYREGGKKLIVDIDFREPKIFLGKGLIKAWAPPYQEEKISKKKKEEIYRNIKKYLLERYGEENIIEEN